MRKISAQLPNQKNRSGVVIISLALVLAALGIAVGVSSLQNLTNSQRESTGNAQGNLALNCSESAVEIGLACIAQKLAAVPSQQNTITSGCTIATLTRLDASDPSSCSYSSAVTEVRGSFTIPQVAKDDTEVIRLVAGNPYIRLSWKPATSSNVMEVNLLEPVGSGYTLVQEFYSCNYSGPEAGLTAASYDSSTGRCNIGVGPGSGIRTNSARLVQITPRKDSANNISVDIQGTNNIYALQGYEINTTGIAGEALRNTDVLYLLPSNARVFNNTLYADSITVVN